MLSNGITVPPRRINEIVHGTLRITADTALRLGQFFAMEAPSWMNLESYYDLQLAQDELGEKLKAEVEAFAA